MLGKLNLYLIIVIIVLYRDEVYGCFLNEILVGFYDDYMV